VLQNILKQPALAIAALNAAIKVVGTIGFHWFTQDNAGALVILIDGLSAAAIAWTTRPVRPAVFTALISAALAFLTSYGFTLPGETVAAINMAVFPFLAFLTSNNVSPITTLVSRPTGSVDQTPEASAHEHRVAAAKRKGK
jgi:hypothetical protein